ncbi:protein kinase, putative [Entamoeba histolytica HM-1:IMSS-B]|uniref:Protein kinase with ankyrin repeats, putative n=5 Tax=Entamoeba histolytica TaxID=5759 RepID=C4LXU6_ENTH1|nr:protein kinase with ankyrin repeats, putative [Entamoeba histolytica HM-1:IMSS]EMH72787.1 protein kinase, putative [Entamoeba histolytica HM-1:IMSS-B]EMS11075.1 interleukin-1 receptor-associated kinase [Entamoeba histolytica HM-3:IMSS]ENY64463.1 interleukin-1 receptor-associated kinase, putative [Entamoeba histolytica HM-1:IMSS-A]GAT93597.1 protein kinase with ankyrin repeats putative [Entamoeba histolytica]EAL43439.1 protein kinase with ankyrin repeats, putative [Entamoeba histolytica HM-1|eukprot:XP_648824.1 protein kinase with ankyrin repeats, putative [Entamoeba histolytica HM-1:IMSS]
MFKKTKLINIVRNETADKVKEYLNKKKVDKKTFEKFKTKEENPLYVSMIIRKDFDMSQELIKVMIKVKADINKYDEAEQTILHYVCNTFTSDASFIMALLQFPGINVNAKNRDEQTPLHIFCNHFANVQSYKTVLQKFVELHAEIDATNSYLETPLIKTVKNQKLRGLIVQFLIDNGANINVANKAKNTALHFVVVLNRVDLINILVKGGADIYCLNNKNESPLSLAKEKGSMAVITKLYEVHNLLQWLSSISNDFVALYARKFLQQELHPKLLKSLSDEELTDVLEVIVEEEKHITILKDSLRKFELILPEEKEIKAVVVTTPERKPMLSASKRSSLPANVDSWTIGSNQIEFTGETKPSRSNKVGTGSTCSVYRGIYKKINSEGGTTDFDVAVKVMDEGIDLGENSEFLHEFEIQKTIAHKNIVKFFGIVIDDTISIVMEFCSHFSLFDVLNDPNQQVDFPTALNFCEQMSVGLGVLHNNKPSILHRDFKSLNVLVTNDYTLKISDFGMSRFDTTENREKDLKELSGTIPYCSPEIIPSDGHQGLYTTKSDIYSLGIVFWEIFRRVVFGSYTKPWFKEYNIPAANDFAILNLISEGKRPTLEIKEYNEACKNYVPPSVHQLYYSCVDEEPDKRPNAEELIKMIESMKQEYIHNNTIWNKYYVPVGYKKM